MIKSSGKKRGEEEYAPQQGESLAHRVRIDRPFLIHLHLLPGNASDRGTLEFCVLTIHPREVHFQNL